MALPPIEGKQREVLCLPERGHYIVLGTAGSGKTTLAVLRAEYLSKLNTLGDQKVLLVTFNKSLVTYLNSISDHILDKVDVLNYHKFARGYLSYRGMLGRNDIVTKTEYSKESKKLYYIKLAINEVILEIGINSSLSRPAEVFNEEINWIQRMGIVTLEEYVDAERVGRGGTRITRDNRPYFFKVYTKYLEVRSRYGYKYDWDDLAYYVREEFKLDDTSRVYKHIIIDEGQDLSPVMLQSLVHAMPEDGSLTFFGDVAQQIYGGRISWRNAGINVTKDQIWKFDQNYRNSKEIAELAVAISKLPFFKNNIDLVTPKYPTASAPLPALVQFASEINEISVILNTVEKIGKTQTVAILVRDRETVKDIKLKLAKKNLPFQELNGDMNTWDSRPGISVGTYHSAKGLEFDAVILPYCNSTRLPDEEKIIALEDRTEALSEEVKLTYVGVTRARRTLILTYTGELTELLPSDDALYQKTRMA